MQAGELLCAHALRIARHRRFHVFQPHKQKSKPGKQAAYGSIAGPFAEENQPQPANADERHRKSFNI